MKNQRHSVFYLEDHQPTLDKVKRNLPKFGPWVVKGDFDENSALNTLTREGFDLYLIDEDIASHYPSNQMAGTQVFEKLKEMPTYRTSAPVVIYSKIVTAVDLKMFGHGSDVWMRSHECYEMRRVHGDMELLSRSLLEIIGHHQTHSTPPPNKSR